jgi:hypothetical protein
MLTNVRFLASKPPMPSKSVVALALGVLLTSTAVAEKKRDWQIGRTSFIETRFNSLDPPMAPGGKTPYSPNAVVRYTIASADKIYVLQMKKPHKATLTGNRTVRFAIEKDKAFVIDDKGDERKLDVLSATPVAP